jgi:hypothetical protein
VGSTQPVTDMSTKNFLGGKVRPARRADSSAVLVVPNVKIGMEAQHYISRLSLHDLLWKSLPLRHKKKRTAPPSQKSVLQCSSGN